MPNGPKILARPGPSEDPARLRIRPGPAHFSFLARPGPPHVMARPSPARLKTSQICSNLNKKRKIIFKKSEFWLENEARPASSSGLARQDFWTSPAQLGQAKARRAGTPSLSARGNAGLHHGNCLAAKKTLWRRVRLAGRLP